MQQHGSDVFRIPRLCLGSHGAAPAAPAIARGQAFRCVSPARQFLQATYLHSVTCAAFAEHGAFPVSVCLQGSALVHRAVATGSVRDPDTVPACGFRWHPDQFVSLLRILGGRRFFFLSTALTVDRTFRQNRHEHPKSELRVLPSNGSL